MGIFDPEIFGDAPSVRKAPRGKAPSFEEFLADAVQPTQGELSPEETPTLRRWFLGTVGALFLVLVGRVAFLQIARGDYYTALAEENRISVQRTLPTRGLLYDRFGQPLVAHTPTFTLVAVPTAVPSVDRDPDAFAALLATLRKSIVLPGAAEKALTAASRSRQRDPVVIRRDVPRQEALLYRAGVELPGIQITETARRSYPNGSLFAHLVGYAGSLTAEEWERVDQTEYTFADDVGKTGLERFYEDRLRGHSGADLIERDSTGHPIRTLATRPAQPGQNVVLTVDSGLQSVLTQSLSRELARAGVARGAAVAIDPRNGEVLAVVSLPTYDNNLFTSSGDARARGLVLRDRNQPLFNRAVMGTYPPGSTFKPVVAAGALTEGTVTAQTSFFDTGSITVGGKTFRGWRLGGHGWTNVFRALAQSVNGYFYSIGGGYKNIRGLGIEKLAAYARRFGYGQPTGIDLPSEAAGLIPTPQWKRDTVHQEWFIGDTYNASIGQGYVLATPLQAALAVATVANGGVRYRPHLVREFRYAGSAVATVVVPQKDTARAAGTAALDAVQQGMRQAVVIGTARVLASLPVPAAGKTGTAQSFSTNRTHAWFTAFAPFDHPIIALAIVLEKGGEGSTYAIPVARDALQYYFTRPAPARRAIP